MKKDNIIYWIITGLFSAFMLFSSIPDVLCLPEAAKFITALGYPMYFVQFIGVAKVLGIIAILVPGFPRIKEWAYAGLAFDLIGATYSIAASGQANAGLLFMVVILGFLFTSYAYHHKRLKTSSNKGI